MAPYPSLPINTAFGGPPDMSIPDSDGEFVLPRGLCCRKKKNQVSKLRMHRDSSQSSRNLSRLVFRKAVANACTKRKAARDATGQSHVLLVDALATMSQALLRMCAMSFMNRADILRGILAVACHDVYLHFTVSIKCRRRCH